MQAVIDAPDHGAGVVDRNRAFALLRRQLNDAGLMDRTYDYYAGQGLLWSTFLIVSIIGALQIPQLGIVAATMIAFSSVQIGLLGHDAGHRAVFKSSAFNVVLGTACWSLVLGISFWYWNDRHLRHHANVNDVQSDPDLQWIGVLASTRDAPYRGRGCWRRIYESLQGPGYSLGLAFTFRLDGWRFALRRLRGRRRRVELLLLASSLMLWLWPCLVIGPRWLLVYVAAQVLGGLYLGAAIAPNHKGMPTWSAGRSPDFVARQVLSARNVRPSVLVDLVLGGLNYQIEHHLFPNMSRANFGRARPLVQQFCKEQSLTYDERGFVASYRIVLTELRHFGQHATLVGAP
ncbi:MAG: acyl-CoA desaturase [Chloroflexi bacterium]|nr:acyl-CoA desaturase [Chloroflexota bacterium]